MKTPKTIDITAKEWFDKVNGNSYFSARITLDYSLPTEQTLYLPFQYGYGENYQFEAMEELKKSGIVAKDEKTTSLWKYCEDHNIVNRSNKLTKQLQRDVKSWGKE